MIDLGSRTGNPSVRKRVGIEDMKKDMLKMMDKIDRLEQAVRILSHRLNNQPPNYNKPPNCS